MVNTISDDLAYLAESSYPHPAITWSKLAEEYQPTDSRTIHQLYQFLQEVKISHYGHNFQKLVSEVHKTGRRLREQGESLTDTALISAILNALTPKRKYRTARALIEDMESPTFKQAVNKLKRHVNRDAQNMKDEKELSVNSASQEYVNIWSF